MIPELSHLTRILRQAAATEIMPRFHRAKVERKADGSLVTAADIAAQNHIAAALEREFPAYPLLGEEMSPAQQRQILAKANGGVWVLDPLDGTSNYACGFPAFSISLARLEGGRAVLGAILDPVRDECFTAAAGQGAYLNGEPIRPFAPGTELDDCLAMVDLKRLPPGSLPRLFRADGFRSQRNLGSVALEWCWLAAGRFQLYLHGGQKLWDYAAGRLIAQEAGIVSRQYRADGITPVDGPTLESCLAIAAANQSLFTRWLDFVDLPLDHTARNGAHHDDP